LAKHVAHNGETRNASLVLIPESEGKGSLGIPRRRLDIIKTDLKKMVLGGADWINLAQNREQWRAFVITVTNRSVLQNNGNTQVLYCGMQIRC
jgi:hypothetical protein